jgi:hypothetical protein
MPELCPQKMAEVKVQLRPCPFCDSEPSQPEHVRRSGRGSLWRITCGVFYCCSVGRSTKAATIAAWNERPLEDALAKALEELVSDCQAGGLVGITVRNGILALRKARGEALPPQGGETKQGGHNA